LARTILGPGARVLDLLPDLRLPSSLSKDVSLTPISPLLRDLVGTLGSDDQLEMVACIAWSYVE